jgi:uncharacterized RDD family membrane protein YckC
MNDQRISRWTAALLLVVLAAGHARAGQQEQPGPEREAPADSAVERELEPEQAAALAEEAAELRARLAEIERAQAEFGRGPRYPRPILRVRQDYTLPAADTVREIHAVLGDVTLHGRVERDVVVVLGTARLASTAVVEGSLLVLGGSATVEPGASVERDLVVAGGTLRAAADFSPGGNHVAIGTPELGDRLRLMVPWLTRGLLWARPIVPDIHWVWTIVGVLFLVYLVLNTVLDRPIAASADVLSRRPLNAFLGGLLVLLLSVPVLAIVAASVIGLAVVPILLCALVALAFVGKVAVARAIGRAILRPASPDRRLQAFATFVVGFGVLVLAYMVPVLGFATWALTSVLGLGAAFATSRTYLRRERPAPAAAPAGEAVFSGVGPAADGVSRPAVPTDVPASPGVAMDARPIPPAEPPAPPPAVLHEGLARYPRGTFLDRAAAFALDCILVAIINAIMDMEHREGFYFVLLLVYHVGFWAWKGTTLGGIVCNLRVVRTHGVELRFVDALIRGLSGVLSIAALGIGCLWMINDPERQTWHDKIAGTLVVKVPRDLVLP